MISEPGEIRDFVATLLGTGKCTSFPPRLQPPVGVRPRQNNYFFVGSDLSVARGGGAGRCAPSAPPGYIGGYFGVRPHENGGLTPGEKHWGVEKGQPRAVVWPFFLAVFSGALSGAAA
jgi:hypothetical protein